MSTFYTFIGAFKPLRNQMNKEFKRIGIKNIKEKRWFLQETLGSVPYLSDMTISELETVIHALRQLPDNHYVNNTANV